MKIQETDEKYKILGKKQTKLSYYQLDKIKQAITDLCDENNDTNWILISYVQDKIDVLELKKTGTKGCDEFKKYLKNDSIQFIVHRVKHAYGYQSDFEHMYKNYWGLLYWLGKDVTILAKGLSAYHWNDFSKMVINHFESLKRNIQGTHFQTSDINDINTERLKKEMRLFD